MWNILKYPRGVFLICFYAMFAFTVAGTVLLLIFVPENNSLHYILYALSAVGLGYFAYTVIVLIVPKIKDCAIRLLQRHSFTDNIMINYVFRTLAFAAAGFIVNIAYAVLQAVVGIVARSVWNITIAVFYFVLIALKSIVFFCDRKYKENTAKQIKIYRTCGYLFNLLTVALAGIVILINKGLKQYGGDLMIGAYGIVNRLAFFFVMIVMGLNQGMQPIAGYNFGARQYDRLMHVLKLTVIGATCVTSLGFLLGELLPHWAVAVFTTDEELIRLAAEGMRIVFLCFPIIGFQMVTTNFFQSIGMAPKAIFLSLSRQLLFLLPGLLFLPDILAGMGYNGSWGVWCSMPLSDLLASLVAALMLLRELRRFRKRMQI